MASGAVVLAVYSCACFQAKLECFLHAKGVYCTLWGHVTLKTSVDKQTTVENLVQ